MKQIDLKTPYGKVSLALMGGGKFSIQSPYKTHLTFEYRGTRANFIATVFYKWNGTDYVCTEKYISREFGHGSFTDKQLQTVIETLRDSAVAVMTPELLEEAAIEAMKDAHTLFEERKADAWKKYVAAVDKAQDELQKEFARLS